ncbi:VirB4 family type IV secretion/conjugal transfer ATPase [Parashewanella curva]|uniref:Type IV secretion system protein virB4 n=1 Tax=Parashewanella curva TaxID=2338552 RepID=A0A3L8PZZ5_9GAMM|nr:VirB4 family type IV secretion/conjugal transfer ATPase [Parashewanella curva]RLV60885.1 VirB4 family type IV secretion/conjugal transfer ATPase [Parashewanella curva]
MSAIAIEKITKEWQRENSVDEFIPYQAHVDEHTLKTHSSDYLQIIKLQGVPHESADPEQVNLWKEQFNLMLRNIACPHVCLWTHLIRRESKIVPKGEFKADFDKQLNQKYIDKICQSQLMVNELYLTVIYRDANVTLKTKLQVKSPSVEKLLAEQKQAISALNDVVNTVLSSLESYQPKRLGIRSKDIINKGKVKGKVFYSELLTLLDYLTNGEWQARAISTKDISKSLPRVRPLFSDNTFALKGITQTRFGACLSIKEYPEHTEAGLLNALLSAPFELVLTQSFQFLSKPVATEILLRQQKRLTATGDFAHSQVEGIDIGLDDLTAGRMVYGEHHLVLTVLTDTTEALDKHLSALKSELADQAIILTRDDLSIQSAFYSQLPANSRYRPRPARISSRNFAGFCSFHSYPSGQVYGNQWGDAVTVLQTASGAPYFFNFHEQNFHESNTHNQVLQAHVNRETGKDDKLKDEHHALGNTLIIGASGSGKTVLQGFLISQSKKYQPTQIIFDKDRGLEIYVRATQGLYLPLQMGKPTGFNPFQLEPTADNILFITSLVAKLCGSDLDHQHQQDLADAVKGVMSLPKPQRRLSRCLEFLDPVDPNGCSLRLQKWCHGGELSWVLDNEVDELSIKNQTLFGFDVTEFLDIEEIRTPIVMYLFYRIEKLIDGRKLQIFMDEFWKLLADEYFEDLAQNRQKVIRKQNGIMVYGTQSVKDVLNSPIAHTLIEQCATLILMPNPKARRDDYIDGLHLTEREFELISTELQPNSRQFIIKQGHESIVAKLDLNGFDDELAVISGTTDKVNLMYRIVETAGSTPKDWLPEYFNALHEQRGEI